MQAPSALIFDIARCSLHDGPGIRTTVFIKGCSMDCLWCHNPESKSFDTQKFTNPNTQEVRLVGSLMTVTQVMAIVMKDTDYYTESNGGLTISGGECLMQPAFVVALAKSAKERGLHVALETAGMVPWSNVQMVFPYVDLFLYDYKDSHAHRLEANTKGKPKIIESNFQQLYDSGASIIRRCLIVPTINDGLDHYQAICSMSMAYKRSNFKVELLLYHNLGISKSASIGASYPLKSLPNMDTPESVEEVTKIIQSYPHHSIYLKGKQL